MQRWMTVFVRPRETRVRPRETVLTFTRNAAICRSNGGQAAADRPARGRTKRLLLQSELRGHAAARAKGLTIAAPSAEIWRPSSCSMPLRCHRSTTHSDARCVGAMGGVQDQAQRLLHPYVYETAAAPTGDAYASIATSGRRHREWSSATLSDGI